jgi:hypothetical protein
VAAAISLFGFESGAALATVVGVLVEVPMMLSVVAIVMRSRDWYVRGTQRSLSTEPQHHVGTTSMAGSRSKGACDYPGHLEPP